MKTMNNFTVGDKIVWLHEPSGGYGYVFKIPGEVIGFGRGRVKIRVQKANGEHAERFVKEQSLKRA